VSVPVEAVVAAADAMGGRDHDTVPEVLLEGVEESEHGPSSEDELSDGREHLPTSCTDCSCVSIVLASRVFWPSLTAAALPYYFALPLLVYLGAVPFTSGYWVPPGRSN